MKQADIKVGGFYSLKDGLGIVRVHQTCDCSNPNCKGFLVWEQDAIEPTRHIQARDLRAEVQEPS